MNRGPIGNATSIKTIQDFREELAESRKSGIKKCAVYLLMLLSVATVLAQEGGISALANFRACAFG